MDDTVCTKIYVYSEVIVNLIIVCNVMQSIGFT